MKFNRLTLVLVLPLLAACAHPTAYAPAAEGRSTGYSDQRLAENRYRVSFAGNSLTKRETVETYLLLRAAEVTRDAGYAWFAFDQRDTQAKTTYHTDFAPYPGWGPDFGWYWHSWPYDPWDPFWDRTAVPTTRYEAYAEIIMLTPDQAKGDAHALNAADVIARLSPLAKPPEPQH